MGRKNTNASAVRLRKVSDSDRAVHAASHPQHTDPTTEPVRRMRSSSISVISQSVRRRKRDVFRDLFRRVRDIAGWSGPLKVTLFLVLAFALWLLFFSTAPSTTTTKPTSLAAKPTAGKSTSGVTADGQRPSSSSAAYSDAAHQEPPIVLATVLATFAHDPSAFTQGLLVHSGVLWESTGLYGRSQVRKLDLLSGAVVEAYAIPPREFGEGLCLFEEQLFQITWQDRVGYVYDVGNFTAGPMKTFRYSMEGWGLTHDSQHLLLSDGSATIYFMCPRTFAVKRRLPVKWFRNGKLHPVTMLNELEYIDGVIYANIWMTNYIVLIDPQSGLVKKVIDATALHPNPSDREMTLNGIAWDESQRKLYITGKLWPTMFQIDFVGLEPKEREQPHPR
jgi:glutamine cyclotransferase